VKKSAFKADFFDRLTADDGIIRREGSG